jgi:hypothetical protein
MSTFMTILNLACGQTLAQEDAGNARRLQIIIAAAIGSLLFAAVWGIAAGSSSAGLAFSNVYKVPMVVLLSSLSAIPAGLLAWKLSGVNYRGLDLLQSFIVGVFAATMVLAVLSPLVAIYYHSSAWAGPLLGLGSTTLAIVTGGIIFIRGVARHLPAGTRGGSIILPVIVFLFMQLATSLQFIAIASPILPETTVFDGGVDSMIRR